MKPALIDTNILSFFFRNHSLVVERFEAYLKEYFYTGITSSSLSCKFGKR
jgi:predicted nucleic acid-binding protein